MSTALTLEQMSKLSCAELEKELAAIDHQLFELRLQKVQQELTDTSQFRKLRHRRAQCTMVLRQQRQAPAAGV